MSLLGNLIWLVFGGLLSCIGWMLSGLGLCLTIVGIPFGIQAFKIGIATLAPFGKEVVHSTPSDSMLQTIFNLVWLVLFGWELALAHLVWACVLAVTIIGIPFAKQHIKLIPLTLMPFGRELR